VLLENWNNDEENWWETATHVELVSEVHVL